MTGWPHGLALLIGSILPAGSHSCLLQGVDSDRCRVLTAGRRSAQASLAVQSLDGLEGLGIAHRVVHRTVVVRRDPEPLPVVGPAGSRRPAGTVVADAPPGMAERVVAEGVPEAVIDPLEVERRVVADEDRTSFAQTVEPRPETAEDLAGVMGGQSARTVPGWPDPAHCHAAVGRAGRVDSGPIGMASRDRRSSSGRRRRPPYDPTVMRTGEGAW